MPRPRTLAFIQNPFARFNRLPSCSLIECPLLAGLLPISPLNHSTDCSVLFSNRRSHFGLARPRIPVAWFFRIHLGAFRLVFQQVCSPISKRTSLLFPLLTYPSLASSMARTKNQSKDKGKAPATSSHPPSQPPQVTLFDSDSQIQRYIMHFESREVLVGRYLDPQFLASTDFPYVQTFKEFGWWNFLTIHRGVYEDVIRAFYSNADNTFHDEKSDKKFKTNIGENPLEVTLLLLHNVFGIPLGGEDYASWTHDYIKASQEVIGNDSIIARITDTNQMDLNTRLLHLICCQMIYPRGGSYALVNKIDLWLMQCIKAKRRPNLCAMMISLMIESFTGKNRTLPYGMALSELLQGHINALEQARQIYLNPSQHINDKTATRIGYVLKNAEWTKEDPKSKKSKKRKQEEASSAIPQEPHDDLVIQGLAEVKAELAEVRSELHNLHSQVGQMFQLLLTHFPPPAESPPPTDASSSSTQDSSASRTPTA